MKTYGIYLGLLLLALAQTQSSEKLTAALDKFNSEYPQEKVFLHLDKPYYYSNEDIWFKVYLVAGPDHLPSSFSDNAFTELIDAEGNVLIRNRILLSNGFGAGDFDLPELMSGNYTIRAYTQWMRNFDPDFFFEKDFAIISPIDGNPPVKSSDEPLALSFHPEGGDLIANVKSRVAIKASTADQIGNNKQILIYQGDSLIDRVVTNEDGIGLFKFTPEEWLTYHARFADSPEFLMLPVAKDKGYVLEVDAISSEELVKAEIRMHNPDKVPQKLYLIGQTRGRITYAAQLDFSESAVMVNIPQKQLTGGITQLTLFNQNWQPEAERLFFLRGREKLNIQISTDQQAYGARDSTIVDLRVTNEKGEPVQGSFSLSALDAQQIDAALAEEHIVSNLLLSSDLKGYITNPSRFFGTNAADGRADLDLIMMTHGWRRFTWKDLLSNNYPEIDYGVQKGITVQGKLLTKKGGDPVEGGTISHVGTFNNTPSLTNTQSLTDGYFAMGNLYFYELEENFLKGQRQGRKKKIKELYVAIDTTAISYPPVNLRATPLTGLDTAIIEDHIEKSIERQQIVKFMEFADEARDLGEVVVEGVREEDSEKYGQEFHRLDFDKHARQAANGVTALEILRGRMPNVYIRGIGANTEAILTYNTTIRHPNTNPLILLDGLPIPLSQLRGIPAYTIKKAEVYRGTNELLKAGRDPREVMRGGVLEFYTRTDEELLDYFKLVGDKNVKTLPGGFYKPREFFAPRYATDLPDNPIPDKRMLIHWAPMIQTNEAGEARLSFFNADLATTIQIEVQGLSLTGTPGISKAQYEVKEKPSGSK